MANKKCKNCKRKLDHKKHDDGIKGHEYTCPACGAWICEGCHYKFTKLRESPKPDESICMGVKCPVCNELNHFNEE